MMPKCEVCGSRLEMSVGYTGADWNSKAGEGSGFGWEVALICPDCGRMYTVCYCKNERDISMPAPGR